MSLMLDSTGVFWPIWFWEEAVFQQERKKRKSNECKQKENKRDDKFIFYDVFTWAYLGSQRKAFKLVAPS